MTRVTMAVPIEHVDAANELAACLGYSEADRLTFTLAPTLVDGGGNEYRVASSIVGDGFMDDAVGPLSEPEWGADMQSASDAQAMVRIWCEDDQIVATTDIIAAFIGDDPDAALCALRLTVPEGS